jgi:hypothetical protein
MPSLPHSSRRSATTTASTTSPHLWLPLTGTLAAALAVSVLSASPVWAQTPSAGPWQAHELGLLASSSQPEFLSTRRASLAPQTSTGTSAGAAICKPTDASAASRSTTKDAQALNRLRVGTVMQFDTRTRNVGDAMNHLLTPVRYRVTTRTVDPAVSASVLRRPLPPQARDAGLMTIEQGLLMLIGQEHRIVVDHRARLVAVERVNANAQ